MMLEKMDSFTGGGVEELQEELESENTQEISNVEELKMGLLMEREAGFCGR